MAYVFGLLTGSCRSLRTVVMVGVGLLGASAAWAQGLPAATPHEVGLSAERLERLEQVIQGYIDNDAVAGAVSLIARNGGRAHVKAYGMADVAEGRAMTDDTIFRIASMTKPVTSVAVMMLYEEGHFKLNDPVGQYLPELASLEVIVPDESGGSFARVAAENAVTIRHLLTHTSGIGYRFLGDLGASPQQTEQARLYGEAGIGDGLSEHDGTVAGLVTALGQLPLLHEPGQAFSYGLNTDVLGRLVEVVSGQSFDAFLRSRIFEPLGMHDTQFYLPADKAGRLASLYSPAPTGGLTEVEGTVEGQHLVYSATYSAAGSPRTNFSGGAGLSSTAHDYSRFLQMLLNGGHLDGARILSPKTIQLMTTDHIGGAPASGLVQPGTGGFGLGFALTGPPGVDGELGSQGEYSWLGFFNTMFWVDPEEDLLGILLTQVFPGTSDIQQKFRIMTYQSIVERE